MPDHLDTNLLAASCFGQGQVLVTPMHMALIAAGIANKGVIMTPHLVDQVLDDKQDIVYKTEIKPWITPLSQDEAAKITSAMITAVNQGTAAPGALPDVRWPEKPDRQSRAEMKNPMAGTLPLLRRIIRWWRWPCWWSTAGQEEARPPRSPRP